MRISITQRWDGAAAAPEERVSLELELTPAHLRVDCWAPLHGDPPPLGSPGPTPGLWNHEVVELFLFGARGSGEPGAEVWYLELEFGPHGHYLALQFTGRRARAERGPIALEYRAALEGSRWRGRALVARALLPAGLARYNAHAIHGLGPRRRYLSAVPAPGTAAPDFHQPERSASLVGALRGLG